MTPIFELGRDSCTLHLPSKFHHPTFTRSEVIMLTNTQTHKQSNIRRSKHPVLFATLQRWVNIASPTCISAATLQARLYQWATFRVTNSDWCLRQHSTCWSRVTAHICFVASPNKCNKFVNWVIYAYLNKNTSTSGETSSPRPLPELGPGPQWGLPSPDLLFFLCT